MYSALAFIVVIICIGIPMWWKTTEVYRVTLPVSEIEDLDTIPIEISSRIGIYIRDTTKLNLILNELETTFNNHAFLRMKFVPINLDGVDTNTFKTPANLETYILKKNKFTTGEFLFIEWAKLTDDLLVTSDRTAYISPDINSIKIQNVLKNWIFEEHNLKSILGNLTTSQGKPLRHINPPPQPNYDILISVLNPNPELQTVHWNVRNAVEAYISPFLNSIVAVSNFTLKSQWKYQIKFDIPNKQVPDESELRRHYALPEDQLPHIITAIERKLGSEVSKNPCIHLVVYVPPCRSAPLHIYKANGEKASKNNINSFVSANWGGIIIANPPDRVCLEYMKDESKSEFHINSQDVMQVGLYLLRKIFGIQNDIPVNGATMSPLESLTPRTWEIDTFVRTRVVHLLASATLTLKSLIKLLGDISYIVINDDVGVAINTASENIAKAKVCLANGELENAVTYANIAFRSSERAFFDPSLLALLYFPDEQKYAIYIPLFLPIMIPVLLSILSLKKMFGKDKNEEENNDDKGVEHKSDAVAEEIEKDEKETEIIADSEKSPKIKQIEKKDQ